MLPLNDARCILVLATWAVDPHSFFGDLDPAVFLSADPDPALQHGGVTLNLVRKNRKKSLLGIRVSEPACFRSGSGNFLPGAGSGSWYKRT